jgi:hypothetical protein
MHKVPSFVDEKGFSSPIPVNYSTRKVYAKAWNWEALEKLLKPLRRSQSYFANRIVFHLPTALLTLPFVCIGSEELTS